MFLSNNKKRLLFIDAPGTAVDEIPKGNWIVKWDPNEHRFFLEKTSDFALPSKIYGNPEKSAERYLRTYNHKSGNLGILLSGYKGTGKSLLAKMICVKSDLPVIIIASNFGGPTFQSFLAKIKQNCIIFIDEFEKVYADQDEDQSKLLTILDGSFNSKFLFLLTINEKNRLNKYFLNRPSRIHYLKSYTGLEEDVIEQVCDDMLDSKDKKDAICKVNNYLGEVSMDILISLIEEINLYPDADPMDIVKEMNLRPESSSYNFELYVDGILVSNNGYYSGSHPLDAEGSTLNLGYYGKDWRKVGTKDYETTNSTYRYEVTIDKNSKDTVFEVQKGSITVKSRVDTGWAEKSSSVGFSAPSDSVNSSKKTDTANRLMDVTVIFRKSEKYHSTFRGDF